MASLDGAVWVARTDATVVRIDPRTNRPGPPIERGFSPGRGLAAAAECLWLATGDGTVLRIDPASGRVIARITVGGRPSAVASSDAGVLVTYQEAVVITRIDPATKRVAVRIPIPAYGAIAVGAPPVPPCWRCAILVVDIGQLLHGGAAADLALDPLSGRPARPWPGGGSQGIPPTSQALACGSSRSTGPSPGQAPQQAEPRSNL